jgi:hypothetical protein
MNIEQQLAELTQALKENTAALREILSVGAVTAADTPAKKRAPKAEPLAVVAETPTPEPVVEETYEPECPAPVAEPEPEPEPEPVEEAPQVPDLPVAELRNSLKEVIKGKLLADTEGKVKATFDALRAEYGVSVIKELTDDQVSEFYAAVLRW